MSKMTIMFESPEDIEAFVNIVNEFPYDMDLEKGSIIIDAKSFLGIMNLGVQNAVTLHVHSDSCHELQKQIKPFITA